MAKSREFNEKDYDLVLDACCEPNRNVRFLPNNTWLEGEKRQEWCRTDRIPGAIAAVGGKIPGHRILVDTKLRHVKILHRLSLPENQKILHELRRLSQTDKYRHCSAGDPPGDIDTDVSDEDWPKWMYMIRRMVDDNALTLVRGQLPTLEECRNFGPIRLNDANGISPKPGMENWNVLLPVEPETAGKPLVSAGK